MSLFDTEKERAREDTDLLIAEKLLQRCKDNTAIWMPYHVPSLKNNYESHTGFTKLSKCCKVDFVGKAKERKCPKCGNPCEIHTFSSIGYNKTIKTYIKEVEDFWPKYYSRFLQIKSEHSKPFYIGLYYIRKSKHTWDFNNMCHILQDLMVKTGWLEDDDTTNMIPVYLGETHKKDKPGVIITILNDDYYTSLPNYLNNKKNKEKL